MSRAPSGLARAAGSLPRLCQYLVLEWAQGAGRDAADYLRRSQLDPSARPCSRPGSIDHAATWAQDNEARAARTFAMAIKLREMLFGIFTAIGAAEACDRRDFLIFRAALAHAVLCSAGSPGALRERETRSAMQ